MAEREDVTVYYQDPSLAVCRKEAGELSEEGGLPERLRAQLGGAFYCVHRLDRDTAGVMVYARTRQAAAALSAMAAERGLEKTYLAVLPGRPSQTEGTLRDLLFHDAARNKSFVVKRRRKGVREAELRYRLEESRNGLTLARVELVTGRSHQIRVQFASRGLPLVGDRKYGSPYRDCPLALCACRLAFVHPFTGQEMRFSAPPPACWPWTEFTL